MADYYPGRCSAELDSEIPVDKLRHCCNRGYARAVCAHAAETEADAVQFLIKSDRAGVVEVAWSLEGNHHPLGVGLFSFSAGDQPAATVLEQQALAFSTAYLDQKGIRE